MRADNVSLVSSVFVGGNKPQALKLHIGKHKLEKTEVTIAQPFYQTPWPVFTSYLGTAAFSNRSKCCSTEPTTKAANEGYGKPYKKNFP